MKKINCLYLVLGTLICTLPRVQAQEKFRVTENFDTPNHKYEMVGRGDCHVSGGVLSSKDAYLAFGENTWTNYEIKFKARVPQTAEQVQICAGFRAGNRDDRYFVMLKGGIQHDLYLARLGYMGADDFLALRQLDFQPTPGIWYNFRIQVAGNRIRIFLNNEQLPRIDLIDKNSNFAAAGKVTLGGSWITNEFDDLSITPLSIHALSGNTREYSVPAKNKDALRRQQRKTYQPLLVRNINPGRTEISLDGNWLFSPGYELPDEQQATNPDESDAGWHVMHVPDFWNPIRVWQHGERYGTASKGIADNYWQKEIDRCESYTFDYKKTSTGWYRQWINLPENIQGKNLQLHFDAVSKVAEVYVNGKKAGSHLGMFGDFNVDVSDLLKPGKNLVTVKVVRDYVKNIQDANKIVGVAVTVEVTRKMLQDLAHGFFNDDPAGIWQPVSLVVTDPVRIEDVFIRPNLAGADFDVTVKNTGPKPALFALAARITGSQAKDELYKNTPGKQITVAPGATQTFSYTIDKLSPRLWSPEHPNLYDFDFSLVSADNRRIDSKIIRSGFRTFRVDGDFFYLNGKRYWLRGGNQTSGPLAPNDTLLADKFTRLMHDGNIVVTRTHTVPATETWMDAYDANGVGVSYEGTWSWLFLESSMPPLQLVDLWKKEFYDLLKKYRNHPSLLIWTVNNEMKFYENDPDTERARLKMRIISDVVKQMREIDPTRPIVFDSNYRRNTKRFGEDFYKDIDDGDIDDVHAYYNWYDYSIFDFFKGEFQQHFKNKNRPLISQEMSTGYTDETGHPSRFYTYVHQNPSSLSGKFAYEYADPKYFMIPQAFITKELAEALRRSDDQAAGILHFSLITWFRNVYLANSIQPWPVYNDVKTALQPVLVSAELWGRHFYSGTPLPARICVIDDQEDGMSLPPSELQWQLVDGTGKTFAQGKAAVPEVAHYTRQWLEPQIDIPQNLPQSKVAGKLFLKLVARGKVLSENSYNLTLVTQSGVDARRLDGKKIAVYDADGGLAHALDFLDIKYHPANSLSDLMQQQADVYVLSGIDSAKAGFEVIRQIRAFIAAGHQVLISASGNIGHSLFPEYIRNMLKENGEIMNIEVPESDVFKGIEPLETRYLNNNRREIPSVISGAFRINRAPAVEPLASFVKIHGYLPGEVNERQGRLDKIKGFPLVSIKDKGNVLLSEIRVEKATTDPIAAELLINMLVNLAAGRP
jgi:beta-galactosidase/beta-glucuronidase